MNNFLLILALVCFSGIIISLVIKQIVWGSMALLGFVIVLIILNYIKDN